MMSISLFYHWFGKSVCHVPTSINIPECKNPIMQGFEQSRWSRNGQMQLSRVASMGANKQIDKQTIFHFIYLFYLLTWRTCLLTCFQLPHCIEWVPLAWFVGGGGGSLDFACFWTGWGCKLWKKGKGRIPRYGQQFLMQVDWIYFEDFFPLLLIFLCACQN